MPPRSARRAGREPTDEVARALDEAVQRADVGRNDVASKHLRLAAAALAIAEAADRLARTEIILARDEDDATWEDIGQALGITRQAAHERFRTGPDGMHSRLYMNKAAQTSRTASAAIPAGSGSASKARKAAARRS